MNRIIVVILFLLGIFFVPFVYIEMSGEKLSDSNTKFVTQFKKGQNIPVNMDYVEPFDTDVPEEFQHLEPTLLKDSMVINTRSGDTYLIKALTFSDWDIKSGDFHCVEIYRNGKKIYEMRRMQGWDYLSKHLSSGRKEFTFCRPFNVVDDTVVLLFQGTPFMDQSFQLPIVVLKKGEARLVFNKPYKVLGLSYGTSTEALYFLSKTIERAELFLMVKEAKYDEEGNCIEDPIYEKMQIVDEGIGFGLNYY